MGHSVEEFFAHIETQSNEGKALPNWLGELYLEVRMQLVLSSLSSHDITQCSSTAARTRPMVRLRKVIVIRKYCFEMWR